MRIPSVHYPILTSLGLTENEAVLYQLLLELGPKPANELLKPSGLQRGNLYNTLTRLKERSWYRNKLVKKLFTPPPILNDCACLRPPNFSPYKKQLLS